MLKKLLVCVPLIAVFAVTGLSASAAAVSAPKTVSVVAPLSADRAACSADMPEFKALNKAITDFQAALTTQPPDATKVQAALTEAMTAAVDLGKACLPQPTAPPTKADPSACLSAFMNILSSVLGVLTAAIKVPPDMTAITGAIPAIAKAITAFNALKCLPFDLPVPGGGAPPLPGPPAPPLPAPPPFPASS